MYYLTARNAFLKSCGDPVGEEREWVIEQFDKTLMAAHARFCDAWAEFMESLRFWK